MEIRIIDNIQEAKSIWDKLSPKERLDDLWEFRYVFYSASNNPLKFFAGFENNEPLVLLPLQKNLEKKRLEYFGGPFMESNKIFGEKSNNAEKILLLGAIDEPARLDWMVREDYFEGMPGFTEDDPNYYLNIADYKSSDDFLQEKFSSRHRKKVRKYVAELESTYEIDINFPNNISLEILGKMSRERFTDSWFGDGTIQDAFQNLIASDLNVRFMEIKVNGVTASVSFGIVYNDLYHSIMSSTDINLYPNLGKLRILALINQAIDLNCKRLEFGSGDCGWKEMWHLDKESQVQLQRE